MNLTQLIDQLEALINQAWRVPLTDRVAVNREALFEILDRLRVSLPDEIKQAQRTLAEHDRIVAQAREEARRITEQARGQASEHVEQNATLVEARQRADQMIEQAQRDRVQLQADSVQYAQDVLTLLNEQLGVLQRQIHNGQQILTQMGQRAKEEQVQPANPAE